MKFRDIIESKSVIQFYQQEVIRIITRDTHKLQINSRATSSYSTFGWCMSIFMRKEE